MQTYRAIDWQGRQFQQYHVLRLLKRDRIGALWLAEERQQQRLVVLRLLPGIAANDHEYLHLFEQIALTSSSLEHPHILPVLDSGIQAGNRDEAIPYLVYPYLEQATTLHAHLRRSGGSLLDFEVFRHLSQVARAIDYAHSQQVVHGGVQPAALLLDGTRLLLTDFGLALLLNSDITVSRTYSIDLPYLAPEQVQGRTEAASDLYSLAVIAYQLFAGRLPFEGKDNPYNLLLQQLTLVPPSPSRFNPALSPHVESVLLKALSRQPQQRYPSCSELVDTLNRAWKGLPLDPRDDPEATIVASWSKRFLEQMDLSPSALPTSLPSPPSTPPLLQSSTLSTPQPTLPPLPLPAITSAGKRVEKKTMPPMKITPESSPSAPTERTTDFAPQERVLKSKFNRRSVLIGGASAAVVAAGGVTLFAMWPRPAPATMRPRKGPPGPHKFTPGKPLIHLVAHEKAIMNVAWDSSGRYIASAGGDAAVMLWDVGGILQQKAASLQAISQPTHEWKFTKEIEFNSLRWTSDGRKILVSDRVDQSFKLFDPFANDAIPQKYTSPPDNPDSFLLPFYLDAESAPHSDLLAAVDFGVGQIKVLLWHQGQPAKAVASLAQQALKASGGGNPETLVVIGWSCNGSMLAGLTNFLNLVVWDVKTHSVKKAIELTPRKQKVDEPNVQVPLLRWSPVDPHTVAVAVIETIVIIDVRSGKTLDILSTDNTDAYTPPQDTTAFRNWVPQVLSFTWSPNGRYIVAGYSQAGTTMAVWDLQKKNVKKDQEGGHVQDYLFPSPGVANGHAGSIFDLSWSPDGRYLATGSVDKTILVWQVDADEE